MAYKPHPLRIQRKRTKGFRLPKNAVCVSRPSKWGNPFVAEEDGKDHFIVRHFTGGVIADWYDSLHAAKAGAVRLYRAYLANDGSQPGAIRDSGGAFLAQLAKEELRGKKVACFCPLDQPCHADVLAEIANA